MSAATLTCTVVQTFGGPTSYSVEYKNVEGATIAIEPVDTQREGDERVRDVMREWLARQQE